jgi:hypothetical protein
MGEKTILKELKSYVSGKTYNFYADLKSSNEKSYKSPKTGHKKKVEENSSKGKKLIPA